MPTGESDAKPSSLSCFVTMVVLYILNFSGRGKILTIEELVCDFHHDCISMAVERR